MTLDFQKGGGLIPAIVQHAKTGQVLMLGYMNEEAYTTSELEGRVTFFSRSRQELWTKGETSGNWLDLISMTPDCDRDAILVKAIPRGPTCHLGTTSCFGDTGPEGVGFLAYLYSVIDGRKTADAASSYTAKLLQGPLTKIAQKVGEEGVEAALAAAAQDKQDVINESADLFYHLLVLLAARNIDLEDVLNELKSRHGE